MINIDTMKPDDTRPPIGGWCAGNYISYCYTCESNFGGDKRAYECADCAYARVEHERDNPIIDFSI